MSPDIAPLLNALFWSFAIGFGAWFVMQVIEAVGTFREGGPGEGGPEATEPAGEEQGAGGPSAH